MSDLKTFALIVELNKRLLKLHENGNDCFNEEFSGALKRGIWVLNDLKQFF